MQSEAILGALKAKLKAPVRYFCQVTHVGMSKVNEPFSNFMVLCLGEHSIFMLDREMQKLLGEVYYAHITRVVEQGKVSGPEDPIRIEVNEDRQKGIPAKITVISSEKTILVRNLRCYWETDFMWRLGKIKKLQVDEEKIDLRKFKARLKDNSNKGGYLYCSSSSKSYSQKGYTYFYPNYMMPDPKLMGEFSGQFEEEVEKYTLRITIDEIKQLEFFTDDLRSKAETLAEDQVRSGENFSYIKNAPYVKKMNLVVDQSSWRGWEILLKTKQKHISLIVLRRKFIPPLMDSGQDFVFLSIGGENAKYISQEPANSIYTEAVSDGFYNTILTQRCDALIMNEDTANFYQLHLNMRPKGIKYAYRFIYGIISSIEKEIHKQEYKELLLEMQKIPGMSYTKDTPDKIIAEYMNVFEDSSRPGYWIWCEKVCRYLAYALDGGFYYSRFTLEEVIGAVMGGNIRDIQCLSILKLCIKLLLHFRRINEAINYDNDDLYDPINKYIKEEANKRSDFMWRFNEKVMICLVESGYLQRELDVSGDGSVYPNILCALVKNPRSSLELKSVICRVTLGIDDISELVVFKPLIPDFLLIYNGKNYTLASQAAISLINLTHNNRENKQTLFKQLDLFIKKLETRDQKLLSYTLIILTNLATEAYRRKAIATEMRDKLLKIIRGETIEKEFLSAEIISRVFTALNTIAKDHTTLDYFTDNPTLKEDIVYFFDKFEEVGPKICWLLEMMADKKPSCKKTIGSLYLVKIIKKLEENISLNTIGGILSLIKTLLMVNENIEVIKNVNFKSILKLVLTNSEVASSANTFKLAKDLYRDLT